MNKINELRPVYVEFIPPKLEEGILYISQDYNVANHICACGCGEQVVTPINNPNGWALSYNGGLVSLHPSIGNFKGENPKHAHYFITNNKIIWS